MRTPSQPRRFRSMADVECPLLAISRHSGRCARESALPPIADIQIMIPGQAPANVRLYEASAVKAVLVGCALSVFLFFGSRVVSGSCDDVHVSCEDRINLYPAAPIRLATMLYTWTITGRGMGLILWTAPSPRRHAVTHPTRQQAFPSGNEAR